MDRYALVEANALARLMGGTAAVEATRFVPLPIRLTAVASATLAGLALLWSLLAEIPAQVEGTAAFVPTAGMGSLLAPSSGRLQFQVSGLGANNLSHQQQQTNRLITAAWGWNHRLFQQVVTNAINLHPIVQAVLVPAAGQHLVLPEELEGQQAFDQPVAAATVHYPGGTVLARIANPISDQALNSLLLSSELLTQQSEALNNDRFDLLDNRRRLANQLVNHLQRTTVFAPPGGVYLLAKFVRNGAHVNQADEVLSYTTAPPTLPDEVPIFLSGPMAEQVSEGMPVLLTPRGISRAAYGGIRGRVIKVNALPLLGEGITGVVGSRSLARTIEQRVKAPYLAWVRLQRAEPHFCQQTQSQRCYRWSSGRRPPHPVRLATLADALITTGTQRPIAMVMPALRRALGLVVDNP